MKLWLARQSWGGLFLFCERPVKDSDISDWYSPISGMKLQIDDNFYPSVTYENSPRRMELIFDVNGL